MNVKYTCIFVFFLSHFYAYYLRMKLSYKCNSARFFFLQAFVGKSLSLQSLQRKCQMGGDAVRTQLSTENDHIRVLLIAQTRPVLIPAAVSGISIGFWHTS